MPRNRNGQNFRPAKSEIAAVANSASRFKNLSHPGSDADYGILFVFREYQYKASEERGFSQLGGSASSIATDTIFLPLPTNISDNFSVKVQRFDQEMGGEAVSKALSSVDVDALGAGTVMGTIKNALTANLPGFTGNNLSEIFENFSSDVGFLLRKGMDKLTPNQGRNIDAGTGTTINPEAALSFEGVEMKTHSFDWTLSPKNEQESDNLRLISTTIKRNMHPEYVTASFQRAMFKYPSMVDIFFVGIDPGHFYYFKTCMIQTFNINFTPNGNAILRGGKPASVTMQMQLIENDIHTAEDYGA